jgi:hypothetical protein
MPKSKGTKSPLHEEAKTEENSQKRKAESPAKTIEQELTKKLKAGKAKPQSYEESSSSQSPKTKEEEANSSTNKKVTLTSIQTETLNKMGLASYPDFNNGATPKARKDVKTLHTNLQKVMTELQNFVSRLDKDDIKTLYCPAVYAHNTGMNISHLVNHTTQSITWAAYSWWGFLTEVRTSLDHLHYTNEADWSVHYFSRLFVHPFGPYMRK